MTYVVRDREQWTLPSVLLQRADELADTPFLSFALGDRDLTFGETAEAALAIAGGLAELGVTPGDRVLLMLRNRVEFVLAWFGASLLGAAQVPVNVDYRGAFLEHLVETSEADVLVVEDELLDAVAASLDRLPRLRTAVVVGEAAPLGGLRSVPFDELLAGSPPALPRLHPSDIAAVHFTSGTSGRSKGALIPHAHSHLLVERNRELLGLERGDTYITELPLFHINAQMTVHSGLLVGAGVRVERRFSASGWLDHVRESGATHTTLLGVMLGFLLAQPEEPDDRDNPLRAAWTVPCPTGPATEFRERFGLERIVTSYGSTEVGMVARRTLGKGPEGAAGQLEEDVYEVRIVDEHDTPLPDGEAGELLIRPRLPWTTTLGYVGMPEATVATFRNLWFHTGDLAKVQSDHLWFLDRFSDRIRRRGENVASGDLELVLEGHPAVAEAAVIAVPADEKTGGEDEIKAVIVPVEGAELAPDEVWAWCDDRLPHFAVPRYVELVSELPKTPTAKVRKTELRAAGVTPATADRGQAPARRGLR